MIYDLVDKIEDKKIFPKILNGQYKRSCCQDLKDVIVHRKDKNIFINDEFIEQNNVVFTCENEDTNYLVRNMDGSYNAYLEHKNLYILDKDILKELPTTVTVGTYYKSDKSKNLNINSLGNTFSFFEKECNAVIDDVIVSYINFPLNKYNLLLHPYNQLVYVDNDDSWQSTRKKKNETEKMIRIFSEEGFKYPLCFKMWHNKYYPIACNCRALAAYYLQMPIFPAIIIADNNEIDYNMFIL